MLPELRRRFEPLAASELAERFHRVGLPYAPITRPEDLFDDPQLQAQGLVDVTLADGRTTSLPALPVEIGQQRMGVRIDVPSAGQQSREILAGLGIGGGEIDTLIAAGAVA